MIEPVTPGEGRVVLHLFHRVDRGVAATLPPGAGKDLADVLTRWQDRTQLHVFSVPGHKADVMLMAVDEDLATLRALQTDVESSLVGPALERTWSYLSLTEGSEYTTTPEQYREEMAAKGITGFAVADSSAGTSNVCAWLVCSIRACRPAPPMEGDTTVHLDRWLPGVPVELWWVGSGEAEFPRRRQVFWNFPDVPDPYHKVRREHVGPSGVIALGPGFTLEASAPGGARTWLVAVQILPEAILLSDMLEVLGEDGPGDRRGLHRPHRTSGRGALAPCPAPPLLARTAPPCSSTTLTSRSPSWG